MLIKYKNFKIKLKHMEENKKEKDLLELNELLSTFNDIISNSIDITQTNIKFLLENESKLKIILKNQKEKRKLNKLTKEEKKIINECEDLELIVKSLISIILEQNNSSSKMISKLEIEKNKTKELNEKIILENKKLKLDQLTWLKNRHSLYLDIEQLLKQKKDYNIAILDIDDFKQINTKYWHWWWDSILKFLTKFVQSRLPKWEYQMYRLWGEEFIVISTWKKEELKILLNNILEKLKSTTLIYKKNKNNKINLSFSGWIANLLSEKKDFTIKWFEELLEIADNNLYFSKNNWKSQIK